MCFVKAVSIYLLPVDELMIMRGEEAVSALLVGLITAERSHCDDTFVVF